ncbi:MAG: ATP-binding protein, partial [Rhodospirillales bacterium]|nr:ATP-binding protein [Rhodospirillales bacterium]
PSVSWLRSLVTFLAERSSAFGRLLQGLGLGFLVAGFGRLLFRGVLFGRLPGLLLSRRGLRGIRRLRRLVTRIAAAVLFRRQPPFQPGARPHQIESSQGHSLRQPRQNLLVVQQGGAKTRLGLAQKGAQNRPVGTEAPQPRHRLGISPTAAGKAIGRNGPADLPSILQQHRVSLFNPAASVPSPRGNSKPSGYGSGALGSCIGRVLPICWIPHWKDRTVPGVSRPLLLRFPAQPCQLKAVREAVRVQAEAVGLDAGCARDVMLAVDEACKNIIQHAYAGRAGEIVLEAAREDDCLVVRLIDFAEPVDPATIRPRALDELRPGGLGTHFIREIMDDIRFLPPPAGAGNLLQMVKRIGMTAHEP